MTTEPKRARSLADLDGPTYWNWRQLPKETRDELVVQRAAPVRKLTEMMLPWLDKHKIPRDDPDRWLILACFLASKSRRWPSRRGRGAPRKWKGNNFAYAELIAGVELYREAIADERGCAVADVAVIDACERLIEAKPNRYGTKKGGRSTAHTLRNRYNEAPPPAFIAALEALRATKK